uniref:Uncharacterized protein n=1 Tax=uncultured bacterium Contig643 TaxID=1393602 RepID=W0FH47_9BACT|nr:hypothetical protein [uncultured bacterium Contig643]
MNKTDTYLDKMLERDYRTYSRAIKVRKFKNKAKAIAHAIKTMKISISWHARGGVNDSLRVRTVLLDDVYPVGTILLFQHGTPDNYPGEWEKVEVDPCGGYYRRIK